MKYKPAVPYDDFLRRQLKEDREFAIEYLKATLEESDDPRLFLNALRHVAEARGGMAKVAKAAGITRESLYRALSERGNPRFTTLHAVTKAVGLKLTLAAA
jgi:probable addiction module antidote protein